MDAAKLQTIQIPEGRRRRSQGSFGYIILGVIIATGIALYFAKPWARDTRDGNAKPAKPGTKSAAPAALAPADKKAAKAGDTLLTVSGYIINRERIELSPRMMNEVKWIGVKKGDPVKKGEIVVRLDDS